ncbi:RHS repeat-associated core domain-containing protein, partial [Pseudomonas sp. NFX15]|uniref:RHS repeat-associated core domain-containing protein n=1 Tax=Pseudomonas sp. NFX15 TaxID=2816958 RepID=UPI003B8AD10C
RLTRVRHLRDESLEHISHDLANNLLIHNRPGPTRMQGNRLRQRDDSHYDYDAYGNLIRERRDNPSQVTEYHYDGQHRLTSVTTPDGRKASYRYDAFGRRIAKTVDGQTTQFFWQGEQLIAESGPNHYRSYLYEPGTFRPLVMLDGKGRQNALPFYYQLDHLGTPQELTNHDGQRVWSARYSAYGKLREVSHGGGEPLEQPLRFQGQYCDAESGLHYNRHRYYHPDLGRYLTPDPVKLAGGLNPYQYTRNPTGWVDPLGLSGNCPGANKSGCSAPDDISGAKVNEGEPSVPDVSRRGAFRQAKADAGIPRSQQPDIQVDDYSGRASQVGYVDMTDKNGKSILNNQGVPIRTRHYQFTREDGFTLVLQDHAAGHKFNAKNNAGDQGPHFNVRPADNLRSGKVEGAKKHYPFGR